MNQRTGATLMEVLVAIFVMALGLMGLLVLFPLGALSMAQAIQDSQTARAAANGAAIAEIGQIRNDSELFKLNGQLVDPFDNPNPPGPLLWPPLSSQSPPWDGASFPVYVDPLFVALYPNLGAVSPIDSPHPSPGIPRRSVSFVENANTPPLYTRSTEYRRWFSLPDDLNFNPNGIPFNPGISVSLPGSVQREGRYSWAYLLRRPRWRDKSVVDLVGVVYSGRSEQVLGEQAYGNVKFDTRSNIVGVSWGVSQEKPRIRFGTWILDATMYKTVSPTNRIPDPHGFFYRVVGVTDGPSANEISLELQTPPRRHSLVDPSNPASSPGYGVVVVMENVVDVFEKGPGWLP